MQNNRPVTGTGSIPLVALHTILNNKANPLLMSKYPIMCIKKSCRHFRESDFAKSDSAELSVPARCP